jgi:hypothetical protein
LAEANVYVNSMCDLYPLFSGLVFAVTSGNRKRKYIQQILSILSKREDDR